MKKIILLAVSGLVLACASSSSAPSGKEAVDIAQPEILLVQIVGPEELNWPAGEIEVQYGLRVTNTADQQITLRNVQIETLDSAAAYTLYKRRYFFSKTIAPLATEEMTFWAKAYSQGKRYGLAARSPISVRTIAFFESPAGNFRKVFVTNLSQAVTH